jgi:hypothetical protein
MSTTNFYKLLINIIFTSQREDLSNVAARDAPLLNRALIRTAPYSPLPQLIRRSAITVVRMLAYSGLRSRSRPKSD